MNSFHIELTPEDYNHFTDIPPIFAWYEKNAPLYYERIEISIHSLIERSFVSWLSMSDWFDMKSMKRFWLIHSILWTLNIKDITAINLMRFTVCEIDEQKITPLLSIKRGYHIKRLPMIFWWLWMHYFWKQKFIGKELEKQWVISFHNLN